MKKIVKFQAVDGSEFESSEECEQHEDNCQKLESIMSRLSATPDSCSFVNGGGYLQHSKKIIQEVRLNFLEFVKRYTDHKWVQQSIDGGDSIDPSWAGRIISDACPSCVCKQWHRFMCIDSNGREWGQPFYANNPGEATQKQLN